MKCNESYEVNPLTIRYQEFIFLFSGITLIALHLKGDIGDILGVLILPFLYLSRYEFNIDNRIYKVFILIALYILLFTIISENPKLSFKADVEIFRSFFIVFVGWQFCKRLEGTKLVWLMSIILFSAVFGNLFFAKTYGYLLGGEQEFFSYHNVPNKSAFMYAFHLMIAGILFLCSKSSLEKIVNVSTIILCLYLVFLVNCRSVWVGLAASSLYFVWFSFKIGNTLKYIIISAISGIFVLISFFFNIKGIYLSYRDIIWRGLIEVTITNKPFFGFGINTNKGLLETIQLDHLGVGAHNSFVEIFSSSGILGVIFFSVIIFYLVKILVFSDHNLNRFYIIGFCGLICFVIISLFEMKFFSFHFFSTIWAFVGFCLYGISKQSTA